MKKYEALVIVAHPDDETIWMGGTILRNKDWKWTILSLCRAGDLDRKPKFDKACKIYNAQSLIYDLDDEILKPVDINEITAMIKKGLPKNKYDIVFTHGENGEYRHIRHVEVHKAVDEMISRGELKSNKIYYFNYKERENFSYPELRPPTPIKNSDLVIELSNKELELKKRIIKEIYGYPNEKGFELMSCNKIESFILK